MKTSKLFTLVFPFVVTGFLIAGGRAQSGGDFVITKSVIANGGGASSDAGSVLVISGTIGQPNAGANLTGSQFNVRTGFWTPEFAPTAARASIRGRVRFENGQGIRGVTVSVVGGTLVQPRFYLTSSLGYFVFEDLEVGTTYLVSVSHGKYAFAEPSQALLLNDDLTDVDFVASW